MIMIVMIFIMYFEKKLEDEASLETKYEIGKYLLDNLEKLRSSDILD